MKVTYKWLQEFVDIPWTPEELAEKLTLSGSEVDSVSEIPRLVNNIVVGLVESVNLHPNADRLRVCIINLGGKSEQIVCGAPNIKQGQFVPVAVPGAELPSGLKIKKTKVRGENSHGMVCSESELGLSNVSDSIMVLDNSFRPGTTFDPENTLDDTVLNVFINPNRPDCMSVRGLAREIAALSGNKLISRPISLKKSEDFADNNFTVEIVDEEKCPRYCGVIVKGIEVKPSSYAVQQRLYAVGVRPVNNIVDATNYILVEYGQPLHAFDLSELNGSKIVVKTAEDGQTFTTLDNISRSLNANTLMICDGDKPVAIGGIMGGLNSGIKKETTEIFLESAYFQPNNILKTAKYLGLSTEASYRFERGMDPNFCLEALQHATAFIQRMLPDSINGEFIDVYPKSISTHKLALRKERLNNLLGTKNTTKQIKSALAKLELVSNSSDRETMSFTIPTFRHDLSREADLIEEFSRVVGLENVKPSERAEIALRNVGNPEVRGLTKIRSIISEFGFVEAYNYSMIDLKLRDKFKNRGKVITLKNPISPELGMLRPSLIPGLLQTALFNRNRDVENLRIFELGKVHAQDLMDQKGVNEANYLAGIVYGKQSLPSWDNTGKIAVDFFTLKGVLESFFKKISLDKIQFIYYDSLYMEQACSIDLDGRSFGSFGRYREGSLNIEFGEPTYIFELDTRPIIQNFRQNLRYTPFSKYPPAKRELAFVIPDSRPVQDVIDEIRRTGGVMLKSVVVDDVYKGKPVPDESRSVKVSLRFYAEDRSLQDKEIETAIGNIIQSCQKKFNIDIRH